MNLSPGVYSAELKSDSVIYKIFTFHLIAKYHFRELVPSLFTNEEIKKQLQMTKLG